jgi:hypothetical protein
MEKMASIFWKMEADFKIKQMEDNFNNLANERRPQYFGKWKTTSISWLMEDDLNMWKKATPMFLAQAEFFSTLLIFPWVTFLPKGVVLGFLNFAWPPDSQTY